MLPRRVHSLRGTIPQQRTRLGLLGAHQRRDAGGHRRLKPGETVGGSGRGRRTIRHGNEDENEVEGSSEQIMGRPGHTYGRREAEFDENNDDEAEHVDATSTTTPQSTNAKKTNRLLPGSADDRSGECQAVKALPIPC